MVKITLKDGSVIEAAEGATVLEIAEQISQGLARAAAAGELDGEVVELTTPVTQSARLNILTFDSEAG